MVFNLKKNLFSGQIKCHEVDSMQPPGEEPGEEQILANLQGEKADKSNATFTYNKLSKILRFLLTIAGIGGLVYLVYRMGWRTILDNITHFGAWFIAILFVQLVWVVLQTISWYIIQNTLFQRAPLFYFIRIKIISDTMNTILPTANLGGDALRIYMIRRRIPLKEGVAGVMVDKTVESIAGTLFMACGILITILLFTIPKSLIVPAAVCLFVLLAAITLLIFFQLYGFYRSAMRLIGWIPAVRRYLKKKEETLSMLDNNMRCLYRHSRHKIPLAIGLHFLARLAGAFEVLIIMWVLNNPISYFDAWFISAAVTIGNTILFIVPGHWGVQEGMYVMVLRIMNFHGSIGLSLAIIRRIRRIFLLGFGLLLLHLEKGEKRPYPNESIECH
jgi:uncharacterized membrane protein YbhN (UPF0104 family)